MERTAPLRQSPLEKTHNMLEGRFVPYAGWSMPVQYGSIVDEHHAVRQRVGIFDVSHMGEVVLQGPTVTPEVDRLCTGRIDRLLPGQGRYTLLCNDRGGILDDVIVYRLEDHKFLMVCNAASRPRVVEHLKRHLDGGVAQNDRTDAIGMLALQGPRSPQVLHRVVRSNEPIKTLPRFHCTGGDLERRSLLIARTGYTGEDGYEIYCHGGDAPLLWDRLMESGREYGIRPVGLGARDTLRLEAGLRLYGNDMDENTTPLETGLAWAVDLENRTFVGKDALLAEQGRPPTRRLIGMELLDRGIARAGYPVLGALGQPIGKVTSGCPSPTLKKSIAFARVDAPHHLGTEPMYVEIRGRRIPVRRTKLPFYRREN